MVVISTAGSYGVAPERQDLMREVSSRATFRLDLRPNACVPPGASELDLARCVHGSSGSRAVRRDVRLSVRGLHPRAWRGLGGSRRRLCAGAARRRHAIRSSEFGAVHRGRSTTRRSDVSRLTAHSSRRPFGAVGGPSHASSQPSKRPRRGHHLLRHRRRRSSDRWRRFLRLRSFWCRARRS